MKEEILFKSKEKLEYIDFERIINLHKKCDWLFNYSEGLYDLWAMCNNIEQKKIIEDLIKNFTFATSRDLEEAGEKIVNVIENTWNWLPENTIIVAKCDDSKPDGSQALLQSIKNKFSYNWTASNFCNNLLEAAHKINDNTNIILVDDFIGTGDTIKSKHKYLIKKLTARGIENFNVKIVSFAAMEFSKTKLNTLSVDYYSVLWLKKGIRELIPDIKEQKKALAEMKNLESKLASSYKNLRLLKHSLGYKESESLFNLESYNVPNNVFPIFWWPQLKDNNYHKTLFRRL